MKLSGEQFEALSQALLDAFTPGSLAAMVRIQLDTRLEQVAGGGNQIEIVHTLISWAEAQDRVQQLIEGARRANPGNGLLQALQNRSQSEHWFGQPRSNLGPTGDPAEAKSAPSRASPGDERRDAQRVPNVTNSPSQRVNLRDILAELYPEETSARRVVADAGLNAAHIAFSGQAANNWHAILNEASKTDQVKAVLAVALREYGENKQLQEAAAAWRAGSREEQAPVSMAVSVSLASEPRPCEVAPEPVFPIEFDWVTIPAGAFLMGSDKEQDAQAQDNELPQHKIMLPEYRIARTPITVAQFAAFVQAASYRTTAEKQAAANAWRPDRWKIPPDPDWAHPHRPFSEVKGEMGHPVTFVSWDDAQAFCKWVGVCLPSEAEWEKAARGVDGRVWPWGNQTPRTKYANFNMHVQDTTPVGVYPAGASPYGVLDMAGNVWEWTCSLWGWDEQKPIYRYPYNPDDGREHQFESSVVRRVLRGGSYDNDAYAIRCAYRIGNIPESFGKVIGFRVVWRKTE